MHVKLKHTKEVFLACACAVACDQNEFGIDNRGDAAPPRTEAGLEASPDVTSDSGLVVQDVKPSERSEPCESLRCPDNAVCRESLGSATCVCTSGFVDDSGACRRAISCDELHGSEPGLASGAYWLAPAGSANEIRVYCEMAAGDGGWTLILNQGTSFDPQTQSAAASGENALKSSILADAGLAESGPGQNDAGSTATCYDEDCVSAAYSSVRVRSDVMLDVSDGPIKGVGYSARVIITGIGLGARGRTLRELFTTGPYFIDADDNSNVMVSARSGTSCADALPVEMGSLLCDACQRDAGCGAQVLVFGDGDSACATYPMRFAIGAASSQFRPWGQCAGWPQAPKYAGGNFFPNNFRVWLR